jgi:hypothetical protein
MQLTEIGVVMGLKDLVVPKWKHSKTEIRLAALDSLNDDPALLAEIAQTDSAPEVRIAALQKISDEAVLTAIIDSEQNEQIRQTAFKKREALFEKIIATSRDVNTVVATLEKYGREKAIADYLCEHPIDNTLQISLIRKITAPHLLCKITEHECSLEAGESIVGMISEKELLQRIAGKASNKKIRSLAQKKIETLYPDPLREQQMITRKLEQCLDSLATKVELQTIDHGAALLEASRSLWNEYDPGKTHPLAAQFSAAEDALTAQIAFFTAQKAAIRSLDLLAQQAELLDKEPLDAAQEKLTALQQQWHDIDQSQLTGGDVDTAVRRFTKASGVINDKIIRAVEEKNNLRLKNEALDKCCEDLEKLIQRDFTASSQDYNGIIASWDRLNTTALAAAATRQRFADLQKKYEEKAAAAAERKQIALAHEKEYLLRIVESMESAAGASPQQAGGLHHDVAGLKRNWGKQYPLAHDYKKELDDRFTKAYDLFMNTYYEFKEQNSWQEWANENVKTKLCAEIELLETRLQQDGSLQNLARKVSVFENQWKRARVNNSEKANELDTRFYAVCQRIYGLGLTRKSELLATLKSAIDTNADHDISETVKNIQKQWNDIGYLPPEIEKEIADAFFSLCNTFFAERKEQYQKHSQEMQQNIALREEICKAAESLADSSAWKETVSAFGELQKKWEDAWPAPMKRSRELWQIFNGYRDSFFDKYNLYKQSNSADKEELCEKAGQLLALLEPGQPPDSQTADGGPAADLNFARILNDAIALQRRWKESGPATKEMSEKLWNRFHPAIESVFAIVNKELSRNCACKEALIKEAEELAGSDEWDAAAAKMAHIREEWKKIKPAARRDEQALWTRLQAAGNTFFERRRSHFDDQQIMLRRQCELKESLITDLEILVRIAGKGELLKSTDTASNAEILKRGISLKDEIDVEGDSILTDENIDKKVIGIVKEWKKAPTIEGREHYRLERRFNEILDILRNR